MAVSVAYLIELLKASEDFAGLDEQILTDLAYSLEIVRVSGGEQVLTEGAQADSMFILVSGRLRVTRQDRQGQLLLYNEVLPGDCVGETGMILEQPRTANINAMRDSFIARLTKEKFNTLFVRYPLQLNKVFSHAIYRHLRHQNRISERRRAQSFFIVPTHKRVDIETFSQTLNTSFSKYGTTKTIACGELEYSKSQTQELDLKLDKIESENDFIIYQGVYGDTELSKHIFHHADQLVYLADGHADTEMTVIESELQQESGYDLIRKHLALEFPDDETLCTDRNLWQKDRDVERIYPIKINGQEDHDRLSRFLTGRAIGLVLGGGGARGFAHIGVLKAFKEKGIPIDIVGGNSMGAVIGACYVLGIPLDEIHLLILGLSKGGMKLTFPLIALMSNKNLAAAFKQGLGEANIENLWLPYFSAACNLTKAETTVLENGPLWRAVLASNSPAGLFPPVVENGELLVDGAILENVPVQAMRVRLSTALERRRGNGKIIAIDVDLKEEIQVDKDVHDISNWQKIKSHLDPKKESLPGIFDILMQVAHIGGLTKQQSTRFASDHYFEPPLSEFSLMDYKRAEEIIEAGYEYAKKQIEDWDWYNK